MPPHGRHVTIQHGAAAMSRAAARTPGLAATSMAPAFDMYYETDLSSCTHGNGKNLVILSGTNGATYLYWPLIAHFKEQGWCTLTFDYRSHGRSETAPGTYTAELFGEDAAVIIRTVFGE